MLSLVACALLLTLLAPPAAQAQARPSQWREADVIRLAHERHPAAEVARATVDLAEARARAVPRLGDPSLGYEREALAGDESQDVVRLTVPVDLHRNREVERLLARATGAGARARAAETRADITQAAVLAFYDVLIADQQVQLMTASLAQLEEAARVLARREQAGTASGYERARLELATELARSRVNQARAEVRARTIALVGMLDLETAQIPELAGDLTTAEPAPLDELVRAALDARAAVGEASRAADATREARAHAAWSWLPTLELSAGLGTVATGQRDVGYVAGLSLSLPVFSRGRMQRAEAEGEHRIAAARLAALEQGVRREVAEARHRLVAARGELERFDQATTAHAELLARAAESGYREGHRSIVELLDAQRTRSDVMLRRLELAAAAKRAEVRLRRATGELR